MGRKKQISKTREPLFRSPTSGDPLSGRIDPDLDPVWVDRIQRQLIAWFRSEGRLLPWRATRDPYRILVSEMMLIQTTVATVVPYYARFLTQFPTLEALAKAEEAEVIKAWEGLGYYRRARQLQAAARAVLTEHGGNFPRDLNAVRALPGVGRYIAGAVISFAFDQPAPIVEANTQRVLARWLAWPDELQATRTQARLWEAATRLVPDQNAGEFNQAFMELGALICIPRVPLCLACPVASACQAKQLGQQDQLPVVRARPAPKEVAEAAALIHRGDRYLLLKRGEGRLWEHFWEFPTLHITGADPAGRSLGAPLDRAAGFQRLTGTEIKLGPVATSIRFGVTTHRVQLEAHRAEWVANEVTLQPGWVEAAWVAPDQMSPYLMSAATRRLRGWLIQQAATSAPDPVEE